MGLQLHCVSGGGAPTGLQTRGEPPARKPISTATLHLLGFPLYSQVLTETYTSACAGSTCLYLCTQFPLNSAIPFLFWYTLHYPNSFHLV